MAWFKEPDFKERQNAAAQAHKAAMAKFRAKAADPAAAEGEQSPAAHPSDRATAKQVPAAEKWRKKRQNADEGAQRASPSEQARSTKATR